MVYEGYAAQCPLKERMRDMHVTSIMLLKSIAFSYMIKKNHQHQHLSIKGIQMTLINHHVNYDVRQRTT